ncbi:phage baseplate plug family protein [Lactiplantibacillus paraxiangfangensis]|uniref:phage baseplate plug family protein n=1 Tax=Lactiplantibacillus paraxiangfangensis TaxID=3076224 RepID=UPI0030C6B745
MAESDSIEFDVDQLPQKFNMTLAGEDFTFRVYRSEYSDYLYIDVYDEDEVPIVLGEKMEYGEPLFGTINDPRLPIIPIIPRSESEGESVVDGSNIQKSVFLFLPADDPDEDDEAATEFTDDLDDEDGDDDSDDLDDNDEFTDDDMNLYGTDETVGDDS